MWRLWWRALGDVLLPRECLVCGERLRVRERWLCLPCAADLPLTRYWERRRNPMADELNALLERQRKCGEAMDYVHAAALLFYHRDSPYKHIPQAVKYGGDYRAGRFFGGMLGRQMARQPFWGSVDWVVPVPLHPLRKWRRGYNQAEVIAAALARELGAELGAKTLERVRRTQTQTRLDATGRWENVRTVFRVRKRPPQGVRHILLVDDTFTTGATLGACLLALRSVLGPEMRISCATLAAVQR